MTDQGPKIEGTLLIARATVPTGRPGPLLAQLCKHFAHKVRAEWSETEGHVDFAPGTCHLTATEGALLVECRAADARQIARVKFILQDHIERFGWREKLAVIWEGDDLPPAL